MAEETNEQKAPAKKPIFVYIAVGLILVLALAGGTAYYVVTNFMGGGKAAAPREPGFLMKLGDPKEGFIVNIGSAANSRYLKIGVILELKPDKKMQAQMGKTLTPDEIRIQDAVLHVLRSQSVENFDPQQQERLKDLIKKEVNRVVGREIVMEVYITNILIQ